MWEKHFAIDISDPGMALVRSQSSSFLTEQMSSGSHLSISDRWSLRRLKSLLSAGKYLEKGYS